MALRIIRSTDPITVERLNVVIYGPPGVGKSSMAFTADTPLLLDFDGGAHRAANRKDSVRVTAWEDVTKITEADLAPYNTVVIDTAGRALDVLSADIIRRDAKMGRGGALTLQGYGRLKSDFVAWLKMLNSFGKDVLLIAHMEEQRNGDDVIERLDVQGGSKGEIYKAADAMGRLSIVAGKRVLNFSPTDAAFGKNPGQLDVLEVPTPAQDPDFIAGIMVAIKDRLNELTEEQRLASEAMEAWRLKLNDAEDAGAINALLPTAKEAPKAHKAMLNDRAVALGLVFDKAADAYKAV